jgi:hypothetical protein
MLLTAFLAHAEWLTKHGSHHESEFVVIAHSAKEARSLLDDLTPLDERRTWNIIPLNGREVVFKLMEGQEEIQHLAEHVADALPHEMKAIKLVGAASDAELRAALEMCLDFCQGQAGSYPHDCAVAARKALSR